MFQVVFAHPVEPRSVTKEYVLIATHSAHTILDKDITTLNMTKNREAFLVEVHHGLRVCESVCACIDHDCVCAQIPSVFASRTSQYRSQAEELEYDLYQEWEWDQDRQQK